MTYCECADDISGLCRATTATRTNAYASGHHRGDINIFPGTSTHIAAAADRFGDTASDGHHSNTVAAAGTIRHAGSTACVVRQVSVRE